MVCTRCGTEVPASGRCPRCSGSIPAGATTGVLTPLPFGSPSGGAPLAAFDGDAPTGIPTPLPPIAPQDAPTGAPFSSTTSSASGAGPLEPGQAFGPRYHIIRLLGIGGMGAVYQAWDSELGVAVAIKVIRPDVMADPGAAAEVERRFKRELLLARQVTHKNVVRIHDLGEISGIKYITMPFVDGADLATVLKREGKLPAPRALRIARSVVSGLVAAHKAGVVHRDLKPANIMIDGEDDALIMDFGIARSTSGSVAGPAPRLTGGPADLTRYAAHNNDATVLGAIVGTVEYMAPEQAKGEAVDQRADIYAFGLILYDMLVGRRRAEHAESAIAELQGRMQTPPPPARSVVPEIPEPLDRVVSRCLVPDRAARYQTTAELEADFDRLDENGGLIPIKRVVGLPVVGALVALALALLVGTWYFAPGPAAPVQHAAVSVLIADFDNRANDPVFEGSLEQALGISIEGASFITSFRRQDAKRVAAQIKPGSRLDESVATLVSVREGIKVVLAGSIEPKGAGYTISLKAVDPAVNKTLATASAFAPTKAQVLRVVGSLAAKMRSVLGDTTSESEKLAAAETFTAGSLEAVRAYSLAQDLQASGKDEPSIEYYKRAVEQDPKFGRAYAGWALSAFHLGRNDEANEQWKVALSLMDRMTEREKYRTQGTYYRNVSRDYEKARDTYETLVKLYPADYVGHNNLAIAYFNLRNFRKALEEGRRAVEIYPKSLVIRTNYSLYGMYAGDFTTAATEARHAIDLDPASPYFKAFLPLAVAALATSDDAAALDAYDRMARTGPQGSSLANIGMADLAMYEGRFGDAEAVLQAGIAEDQKTKNGAAMATKYLALAESYEGQGKTRLALATARKALTLGSREEAVVVPAARIFLRAGEDTAARGIAAELGQHLQPQSRAFGKLIEGEIAARQHRTVDAVEALRAASALTDLWLARFSLGVAYVQAEHYFEGLAELEACQKRQGEATAIFLDDVASFRYLAPLPYWLARAQQGVGQNDASVANYKKFLALKSPTTPDPLAADARRRVGSH